MSLWSQVSELVSIEIVEPPLKDKVQKPMQLSRYFLVLPSSVLVIGGSVKKSFTDTVR